MKKLPSLQESLQNLPKSVPGTNKIMTLVGSSMAIGGLKSALECYFDTHKTQIEFYYICCGVSILGLATSIINIIITNNNISKFDDAFNNKMIYFEDTKGNIMQTVLNTQYIQGITQCDVKFTYEQPELCEIEVINYSISS